MTNIVIDPYSPVPAFAQVKDQIKLARAYQALKPGDVLPSIRQLARQLSVGSGVVRRAYRELCEAGLLSAQRRNHVVVPARDAPDGERMQLSVARCDQLIEWARAHGLSTLALGRLLLSRAIAQEEAAPSYVFVDICRLAAQRSVAKIARAWGIKLAGVAVDDFLNSWKDTMPRMTAVLVSEHVYDDVMKEMPSEHTRLFRVSVCPEERLRRRIARLPPKSAVVVVGRSSDSSRESQALLQYCVRVFTRHVRVRFKNVRDIRDLVGLVRAKRFKLFLFNPIVWEALPPAVKRATAVAPVFCEPDPHSLEQIRIATGVLV